jgi:hypothetical protein
LMRAPVEPLQFPSLQERTYLWRFGVGVIAVFAPSELGPCALAAAPDPADALAKLRRASGLEVLFAHAVCREAGQRVANLAVGSDLRTAHKYGPMILCSLMAAKAAIAGAAECLGIGLREYAVVLARCEKALGVIEQRLAADARTLQKFNRAYRRARLVALPANAKFGSGSRASDPRGFPTYNVARARLIALLAQAELTGAKVKFEDAFILEAS